MIAAVDGGMTLEEAAEVFTVGVAGVSRRTALRRETGGLAPRPHAGGRPRAFDSAADDDLQELLRLQPDLTVAELAERVSAREGHSKSRSAATRALKRLGFTRKKY